MEEIKPIAVIGDIHGCLNELKELYGQILEYTGEVYSVGDLIDRGTYSKEVLQFCIDKNIIPVLGNHEDMMFKAIQEPDGKESGYSYTNYDLWIENGGKATMNSYIRKTGQKNLGELTRALEEKGHYDYIKNFPLIIELDTMIISHGGIRKKKPESDILWNRNPPSQLSKLQIIGHTPHPKVIHKKNHYINIDTGCAYGWALSAVIIEGFTQRIISVESGSEFSELKD
jgi:serine/threonine protein phosphatase 1